MAVGSTFLNSLGLERYGLSWRWPEIDCAHPLDGGDAGVLYRSVAGTAAGLGPDRDRIVGRAVRSTTQMAAYNPNYVGGDIATGAKDIRQVVFGPRTTVSPYRVGVPGMYICSAATPPGPGVHGMCGAHAAADALRYLHQHQ